MSLGVLESARPVVEAAGQVWLDEVAIAAVAEHLASSPFKRPEWRVEPHWSGDAKQTAQYVFVLDSLNFCFWGDPKWQVRYGGRIWDGYWGLAACLRRALDEPTRGCAHQAATSRCRVPAVAAAASRMAATAHRRSVPERCKYGTRRYPVP